MRISKEDVFGLIKDKYIFGIFVGEVESKVINVMGAPINVREQSKKNKGILYYGVFNFYFLDGILTNYSFDYEYKDRNFIDVKLDDISKDEVLCFLVKEDIYYVYDDLLSYDDFVVLGCKGIKIGFRADKLVSFWVG